MNNKTQKVAKTAKTNGIFLKLILLLVIIVLSVLLWQQFNKGNNTQVQTLSREGVVSRIQQLNRLETVAYNVDTVITSQQQGSWQRLWQDEQKGLFIARGRVVAGVDLSTLSPEMVQVSEPTAQQIENAKQQAVADGREGGTLTLMPNVMITVPPVEVFTVYLDDVEVYDWQAGGFFGMSKAEPEILAQAQASAKQEVLKRACADGVMQQAESNAKTAVEQLFAMTGAEVTVATQGSGACQPVD
ncbi:DUF4230 domain-containing protein [Psychrobacter lutiphocae]|uniref:DUF4230 domain-containing protein n=1 Tax=Psychrobacter lutiphocae TaxID=540500 RepID=UPI000374F42F|nr:DUF4230 domain-containing protein [Psychrobacter lutiphocae]